MGVRHEHVKNILISSFLANNPTSLILICGDTFVAKGSVFLLRCQDLTFWSNIHSFEQSKKTHLIVVDIQGHGYFSLFHTFDP